MNASEVPVISTINALPFKLATYLDVELTILVLVVDIPSHYGMLLPENGALLWEVAYNVTYPMLLFI